jgi:hypothetical protein
MPTAGFELAIPATERQQTYVLDGLFKYNPMFRTVSILKVSTLQELNFSEKKI